MKSPKAKQLFHHPQDNFMSLFDWFRRPKAIQPDSVPRRFETVNGFVLPSDPQMKNKSVRASGKDPKQQRRAMKETLRWLGLLAWLGMCAYLMTLDLPPTGYDLRTGDVAPADKEYKALFILLALFAVTLFLDSRQAKHQ